MYSSYRRSWVEKNVQLLMHQRAFQPLNRDIQSGKEKHWLVYGACRNGTSTYSDDRLLLVQIIKPWPLFCWPPELEDGPWVSPDGQIGLPSTHTKLSFAQESPTILQTPCRGLCHKMIQGILTLTKVEDELFIQQPSLMNFKQSSLLKSLQEKHCKIQ